AFVEEKSGPASRHVNRVAVSEPGQVAFPGSARNPSKDLTAHVSVSADVQSHTVARHVVQIGNPGGRAHAPRETDAPVLPTLACLVAREEDLLSGRTPQREEQRPPLSGQVLLAAG